MRYSLLFACAFAYVSAQTEEPAASGMLLVSGPPESGVMPVNLADMTVGTGSGTGGSWITLTNDGTKLYVTDENGSTLSAFAVDPAGVLTALGEAGAVDVAGKGPVYSALSLDEKMIWTGQYTEGSVSQFVLAEDGSIDATPPTNIPFAVPVDAPVTDPPTVSMAHAFVVDPSGKFAVVPDLGLNVIHVGKIGAEGVTIDVADDIPSPELKVPYPRGPGPRHAAFSIGGDQTARTWVWLHVGNEVSNTIDTWSICYADDGFKATLLLPGVPSIPTPAAAEAKATDAIAEVLVTRNSKWLLVSNRRLDGTEGSIAVFAISEEPGLPIKQLGENIPSGGIFPRGMALSADDTQLAVVNAGNAETGEGVSLQMFDFDTETGALTPKGEPITEGLKAPTTVVFKEPRKIAPVDLAVLSALECQAAPEPVDEAAALKEDNEDITSQSGAGEADAPLKTLQPAGAEETAMLEDEAALSGSASGMEEAAEETNTVVGKKVLKPSDEEDAPAAEDEYDISEEQSGSTSMRVAGSLALGAAAMVVLA